MDKWWTDGVAVASLFLLVANVAWADKAEVEKKAKETNITLSIREIAVDKALDMISLMGGVPIKKSEMPKDPPKVTADMKDISVLEAVKLVAQLATLDYSIVDDGILVSAKLDLARIRRGPDNSVSWEDARLIIAKGDVRSVMQSHKREVAITLSDGTRFLTVSPQIDDVWGVIKACSKQGKIAAATE